MFDSIHKCLSFRNKAKALIPLFFLAFISGCKHPQDPTDSKVASDPPNKRCATAYDQENYRGRSWKFCLYHPGPGGWNDRIASFRVPSGMKVEICEHPAHHNHFGLCRTLFSDTPKLGYLGDRVSYVSWKYFSVNDFSLIFASDPQFGLCYPDKYPEQCHKNLSKGEKDQFMIQNNKNHVNAIKLAAEQDGDSHAGIIISGDLTNIASQKEYQDYLSHYENTKHKFNIYPGLGNHDYLNYVNAWGVGCPIAGSIGGYQSGCRTRRMIAYLVERIGTIPTIKTDYRIQYFPFRTIYSGSYSYSWEIGPYYFIQLNNSPNYSYKSRMAGFTIDPSWDWLVSTLQEVPRNKRIILNLHTVRGGNNVNESYEIDNHIQGSGEYASRFQRIVEAYPNIDIIFAGHNHSRVGDVWLRSGGNSDQASDYRDTHKTTVGTLGSQGPYIFFGGGAEFNTFLKVRFLQDRFKIQVISSKTGHPHTLFAKEFPYDRPATP